jgi:hypothetical protein
MVTTNTIGDDSGRTWAAVRAPAWNGSGLVFNPSFGLPSSNNWSPTAIPYSGAPVPFHDARYMEALTSLRKAFPVSLQLTSSESPSGAFSTCLGLTRVRVDSETDDLYLTLGTGIAIGSFSSFEVRGYYPDNPAPPTLATTGYDYETTKAHLLGATVNMTITTNTTTFTANVVITADLFPSDMFDSSNLGVYITSVPIPAEFVTSFYISSVVLP